MKAIIRLAFVAALFLTIAEPAFAQLGMFSMEQRVELTGEWKGDRFPDGRPKVPDSILTSLSDVDAEEAWNALRAHGYYLSIRRWLA